MIILKIILAVWFTGVAVAAFNLFTDKDRFNKTVSDRGENRLVASLAACMYCAFWPYVLYLKFQKDSK